MDYEDRAVDTNVTDVTTRREKNKIYWKIPKNFKNVLNKMVLKYV